MVPAAAKGWLVADARRKGNGRGDAPFGRLFQSEPGRCILGCKGDAMKPVVVWLAAALLAVPALASPAWVDQAIQKSSAVLQSGDYVRAEALLGAARRNKDFAGLAEADQLSILRLLAAAAMGAGDRATAADAIRQACGLPSSTWADWDTRLTLEGQDDLDDSVFAVTAIAQKFPERLVEISDRYVLTRVAAAAHLHDGTARRLLLLRALYAAHWRPVRLAPETDEVIWLSLVLDDLGKGDLAHARQIAAAIGDPNVLIRMVVDKRFDLIVAADPGHFDIAAAAQIALQNAQARLKSRPDLMEPSYSLAQAMIRLGRYKEALAVLDAALATAHQSNSPYTDLDYALPWVTEERGSVLADLGRKDEGLAQRQDAADLPEDGKLNVSQTFNLAQRMNQLNRPKDALTLLDRVPPENSSPYGRMVQQKEYACAYHKLGRLPEYRTALDYLNNHTADAPLAAMDAMECADDVDGVTKAMVARLEDPESRLEMLFNLQSFDGPDRKIGKPKPLASDASTWDKATSRPEVRAAIDHVGRVQSFPIFRED